MAVVQYNSWQGGGIIAVNYEARAHGVTRSMRGDEAKKHSPDIKLIQVPEVRGKADLTKYRDAGREVIEALLPFKAVVERASVDEAYLDITKLVKRRREERLQSDHLSLDQPPTNNGSLIDLLPNTHLAKVSGQERELILRKWLEEDGESSVMDLALGAAIAEEMRASVYKKTGFRCSAGIAHNKMMAKLACGLNKPNKQTVLPVSHQTEVFHSLKLTKLRGLGGKLGDSVKESLHCQTVGDLAQLTLGQLKEHFDEKTARWLHDAARGIDREPVKERDLPKSIGCGKNFRGPEILDTRQKVHHWVGQLVEELVERLKKDKLANKRVAKSLSVSLLLEGKGHISRAGSLPASAGEYRSGYHFNNFCLQAKFLLLTSRCQLLIHLRQKSRLPCEKVNLMKYFQ